MATASARGRVWYRQVTTISSGVRGELRGLTSAAEECGQVATRLRSTKRQLDCPGANQHSRRDQGDIKPLRVRRRKHGTTVAAPVRICPKANAVSLVRRGSESDSYDYLNHDRHGVELSGAISATDACWLTQFRSEQSLTVVLHLPAVREL